MPQRQRTAAATGPRGERTNAVSSQRRMMPPARSERVRSCPTHAHACQHLPSPRTSLASVMGASGSASSSSLLLLSLELLSLLSLELLLLLLPAAAAPVPGGLNAELFGLRFPPPRPPPPTAALGA